MDKLRRYKHALLNKNYQSIELVDKQINKESVKELKEESIKEENIKEIKDESVEEIKEENIKENIKEIKEEIKDIKVIMQSITHENNTINTNILKTQELIKESIEDIHIENKKINMTSKIVYAALLGGSVIGGVGALFGAAHYAVASGIGSGVAACVGYYINKNK